MLYQFEIAKCTRKFKWPSWVIYHINFRQEAASNPILSRAAAAGHREPKIYQQCFNGMEKDPLEGWCRSCLSLDHTTSLCPSTPPPATPQRKRSVADTLSTSSGKREICRNFNTKGCKFPRCKRRHVCLHCHEGHLQHRCSQGSASQSASSFGTLPPSQGTS